METKAIFLDVDGTLVSFDTHRVPQSAIEALQQVHESGIKIIIATGRAFTDLHELEEIPYDAVSERVKGCSFQISFTIACAIPGLKPIRNPSSDSVT